MSHQAYPLQWPPGWPRTMRPARSQFHVTFGTALNGVLRELRLLGARDITISTDIPLRKDGLPYASWREPEDSGVAVYFTMDGESRCIPCDKWDRVKDNLRAIEKTVESIRGIGRWGANSMMNAAFAGFAALPPASEHGWWQVLGVERNGDRDVIKTAYRKALVRSHPDRGGDAEAFMRLQDAWGEACRERPDLR